MKTKFNETILACEKNILECRITCQRINKYAQNMRDYSHRSLDMIRALRERSF